MTKKKKYKKMRNWIERRQLKSKLNYLERELVSALEEHNKALIRRDRAETMIQNFYDAILSK